MNHEPTVYRLRLIEHAGAVPKVPAMLRITQTQGTIVTLRLRLGRLLHDQHELKALSQGRGYRALPGAVLVGDVPRAHTAHVRTDRYLYPVSPVEVAVWALEEQRAEWHVSVGKCCVVGTAEEVWLGEEGT